MDQFIKSQSQLEFCFIWRIVIKFINFIYFFANKNVFGIKIRLVLYMF